MLRPSRTRELLIALFLLGALVFAPPLLIIFNKAIRIFGIPVLYFYLFAAWGALIALVALAVEPWQADDESGPELPGREHGQASGGPTDA
jgi:uncharacterized membrane protein